MTPPESYPENGSGPLAAMRRARLSCREVSLRMTGITSNPAPISTTNEAMSNFAAVRVLSGVSASHHSLSPYFAT